VATVPLSGAQMQTPHGINVNPEIKGKVRHSGQRQVKDNFVNRVVEKCGPAVVRIQTEQKVEVPAFTNLFVCFVELVVITCFQYVFIYLYLFVTIWL
jgi:S1-C subfamily serine protease